MQKRTLIWLLFICPWTMIAQKAPSLKQDSIRLDRENKRIIISYRLSDNSDFKYEYDIQPFFTQDGGQTYKPLEKMKGHFGKDVLAGDNKQIWWQYAEENPDFDGQNLKVKLKVDYKPSVLNLMNEEAMKYSLLLPGLGQTKVRYLKGWKYKWAFTSLAVYGLIGGSFYMKYKADQVYEDYKKADTRERAQSLFDEVTRKQQYSYGLAFLAGTVWATDIVLVGLKGRKNRAEKKRILKRNEEMNTDIGIGVSQTFNFQQVPTLGVRLKF